MTTAYARVISSLLDAVEGYRARTVSLDALKSALWSASDTISSHEERELRLLLQRAEGQLEILQFTADERDIFDESLTVLESVEAELRGALSTDSSHS